MVLSAEVLQARFASRGHFAFDKGKNPPFDAHAVANLAEYRMHYCASLIRAIAYSATANHNRIGVACLVVKPSHASSSSATATSAGKGRIARSEGENKLLDYQFTTDLHFFGVQTRQYSCL